MHVCMERGLSTVLALGLCCACACKGDEAQAAPAEDKLLVFAATSLRDAFMAMHEGFRAAHPRVEVSFEFAGSQELRAQLEQGAAADVFASADQRQMDELLKAGRASAPVTFARNEPVIVVAKEAAAKIHGLRDLPAASGLVIGAPEVPIGRYTLQVLDKAASSLGPDFRAKVEAKVVSRELNVRQVLNKVKLGEAEAGFVYRSDALAAPELSVVTIPTEQNVLAEYPIATLNSAQHVQLARAWLEYVRSEAGQSALQHAGFLPPSAAAP